ncbi:MAG: Abi family protein [Bacilli bacterium]|nr:Abi family protein [Bacilli bacterium]
MKEYKTVEELINILEGKGLVFSQRQRAKRLLIENNYYCVTAYKKLFYKNNERAFLDNVDFEDLFNVYSFDKSFKTIILKHLLFIEQKIKTAISNKISKEYGIKETDYLKKTNYDLTNRYLDENLQKIIDQKNKYGSKNSAVRHYKETYGFVPFWVLSKCLTMGAVRDYFTILKPSDQFEIIQNLLEKKIDKKPVKRAKAMISLFADIRNMCAHDDKLIGYVHERITIAETDELAKLGIKENSKGRSDILALLISVKYFVNRTMYNEFIQDITSTIKKCHKKIARVVSKKEFLSYIGLPENYEELKKY